MAVCTCLKKGSGEGSETCPLQQWQTRCFWLNVSGIGLKRAASLHDFSVDRTVAGPRSDQCTPMRLSSCLSVIERLMKNLTPSLGFVPPPPLSSAPLGVSTAEVRTLGAGRGGLDLLPRLTGVWRNKTIMSCRRRKLIRRSKGCDLCCPRFFSCCVLLRVVLVSSSTGAQHAVPWRAGAIDVPENGACCAIAA